MPSNEQQQRCGTTGALSLGGGGGGSSTKKKIKEGNAYACRVAGCAKFKQTGNDGMCRTHYNESKEGGGVVAPRKGNQSKPRKGLVNVVGAKEEEKESGKDDKAAKVKVGTNQAEGQNKERKLTGLSNEFEQSAGRDGICKSHHRNERAQGQKYPIGLRIAKPFDGEVFFGTITRYHPNEGYYHVSYDDGDSEDMNGREVATYCCACDLSNSTATTTVSSSWKRPKLRRSIDAAAAAAWLQMLERLRSYREENGHCNVPRGFGPNEVLSAWIDKQREQYRLKRHKKKSTMTVERVAALESIVGFQWAVGEEGHKKRMRVVQEEEKGELPQRVPTGRQSSALKSAPPEHNSPKQVGLSSSSEAGAEAMDVVFVVLAGAESTTRVGVDDGELPAAEDGKLLTSTGMAAEDLMAPERQESQQESQQEVNAAMDVTKSGGVERYKVQGALLSRSGELAVPAGELVQPPVVHFIDAVDDLDGKSLVTTVKPSESGLAAGTGEVRIVSSMFAGCEGRTWV